MSVVDLLVRALRKDQVQVGGKEQDVLVLSLNYQGIDLETWMGADGEIVRQQTPFGWSMEASTAEEALGAARISQNAPDILTSLSVPCEGVIADQQLCKSLTLRLSGIDTNMVRLASDRQKIIAVSNAVVDLELKPSSSTAFAAQPSSELLASTPFVQSDHPEIVKQAQAIVQGTPNDEAKVLALYEWVYKNVNKKITVSLPSALDVLKQMEGDCNEHTYLYVALARAIGIPAQIKVGLVYKEGAFYYHAWPAVFVNGWWELDPTLGQPHVDATHVVLLEGEMKDQLKLLSVIGRLKAEVLEQTY